MPKSCAFFTSSIGDTDLARATIQKMREQGFTALIFVIPITATASKRTEEFSDDQTKFVPLSTLLERASIMDEKQRKEEAEFAKINCFLRENEVMRAYVGIPSPVDEEIPYQIAKNLEIPCMIAYEFMFEPGKNHALWKHFPGLMAKSNCEFAVPLPSVVSDLDGAKATSVGHLSIDRAINTTPLEASNQARIKEQLKISDDTDNLVFISGTTQPIEVDVLFLEALLTELKTGVYPNIKLRFGIHPGVKDMDAYFKTLLEVCERFSGLENQFQIILPTRISKRLTINVSAHPYVLPCEVSGPEAASAAEKVAQAVPGALLNESALQGKPSYYHNKTTPYLPIFWFSDSIPTFFKAERSGAHSRKELGLEEDCSTTLARIMQKGF